MKELAPLADRLRERVLRAILAEIQRLESVVPLEDDAHLVTPSEQLASEMTDDMIYAAGLLVPVELREAVLFRAAEHWPRYEPSRAFLMRWQDKVAELRVASMRAGSPEAARRRAYGADIFPYVPPSRVKEWAIERAGDRALANEGASVVLFGNSNPHGKAYRTMWLGAADTWDGSEGEPIACLHEGVAILCWAEEQVLRDRHLPATYIDAGRTHAGVLTTIHRQPVGERLAFGKLTLRMPGESVQLSLGLEGTHETLIDFLQHRRTLGPEAVRHWLAYLTMLSKAGRTGTATWTIDDHLTVAGYKPSARKKPKIRDGVRRMMELFSTIELEVELANGRRWASVPLIQVLLKEGTVESGRRVLDGALLQINPLLYRGVRNLESGELGRNFFPTPPALAQIDHVRHPYAQALGALLAIRWRLAWRNDGRGSVVRLSGENLLKMAGIPFERHDPGRTWKRLRDSLAVLQRIDLLGHYEWTGDPWTLKNVCELEAADWLWDRTVAGVAPVERVAARTIATGDDLRDWRKERGLTQAQAGELLGTSARTIMRAELAGARVLPPKLRGAVESHSPAE